MSYTFERNIVLTHGQPIFIGGYSNDFAKHSVISDLNLFWDAAGGELTLMAMQRDGRLHPAPSFGLAQGQAATGNDRHSIVADPGFTDPARDRWLGGSDSGF